MKKTSRNMLSKNMLGKNRPGKNMLSKNTAGKKFLSILMALAMTITICPQTQLIEVSADDDDTPYCLSADRPVYVSSGDNEENAVDGDSSTRWESGWDDDSEWLYVDLGKVADITSVHIEWETAYAKSYSIQVSDDEENWTEVYTKGNGAAVTDQEISITYEVQSVTDGVGKVQAYWTSIDNAKYKVCIDSEDNVAKAPDGYSFTDHGPAQGLISITEGEHTLIVIALDSDTGEELGRGETVVTVEEGALSEDTDEDDDSNSLTEDIDLTQYADSKTLQGRYVRIYMTEKAMPAYGYSIYEFQVYGTGGAAKRPADYGTNLALDKDVTCSGTRDEWWMYDDDGNITESSYNNVKPENAVDGDTGTSFTSYQDDDQWIYVDLGDKYTLGRVVIDWTTDAGKIYDVQVSSDGTNWTTVHRVLKGYTEKEDNFTCYQENVRYVRVFGYTRVESGSGFGIKELEVYEYQEGDSKENETIEDLPVRQIVNVGSGTYVSGEMYNEQSKIPTFVNEDNVETPIASNDWWTSVMVKTYSNLLCSTPLKAKYSKKGLGVLTATAGWVGERGENDLGTDQSNETGIDFYVFPDNFDTASGYDRVENYGDYSAEIGLMDEDTLQMTSTLTEGSPYIYSDFQDNTVAYINSSTIEKIVDQNGNEILANAGDSIVTDHIAFKSFDDENTKAGNDGAYYCVNVPEGTEFKATAVGSKYSIKITFPSDTENYMSIAAMTDMDTDTIQSYYEHGYAFITDTTVEYNYNESTSKVDVTYTATTEVKRSGFSSVTMQAMYPHQWKYSDDDSFAVATYPSIRGDMKAIWANEFSTTQQFAGLLPTFALPDSDMMDTDEMVEYLEQVVSSKCDTDPVSDAYWEGKNVHPLAISALMADQIGETEIRDQLLTKLKSIFVDWFNYDGGDDECYLIYNKDWGTVYYPNSAYGANASMCDHNFTYGYFVFGAAVLAAYDDEFVEQYGDMVELLMRDYAGTTDDDDMFCKFRSLDQYAGHSWAGGYGDSDSGNNQESASEALFAWVGMYLWGEATGNDTYTSAGAYGFTVEMEAVEQYWFDYDEDNWLDEYPFQATGQIYGASMGYGTYFGGQPVYVYGIQWLPVSEYLTNYGMDQEKCAKIYQGLWDDTNYAIDIEMKLGNISSADEYVTPNNGWQHITWPFLSQTDPDAAYELFEKNVSSVQTEDRANTLWFISGMDQLGYRTNDYVVTGDTITGTVYVKETTDDDGNVADKTYTAEVWNPTSTTQTVTIIDSDENVVGTASVGSKATVSFEIDEDEEFALTQVSTPTIKSTALFDGTVTENVSGTAKFSDTQLVEIECDDDDATVYYTTDGTVPTTESAVYSEKILVSSDTTVKAIAIKDGYIDSAYASASFVIDGDTIQSSDNLALGKTVTASSENGGNTADKAVDGSLATRWQADANVDEYIQVDLGSTQTINTVTITWETAYASKYEIQVSTDGENWTTVATETGSTGEVTTTFDATKARYVRIQGLSMATQYGYSIYELEVYGAVQAQAPTITPVSGTYDGKQTVTMDTSVKGAEIKYTLDGTDPTEDSATYTEPLTVSKSTIIKAVTYRKGMILSDVTESDIIISGTLSLNKTTATIAVDGTTQLSALTDETVTWSSSNKSVATVNENGTVTGVAVGTAVITATTAKGETAQCTIAVTEPVHITDVSLSPSTLEMKNKTSETLSLKITPADTTDDTTATWTSSDENVLTVNNSGTVTARGEGEATVTVTVGDYTATCEITVKPAATTAEMITSSKYNLALNKTASIMPSMQESSGGNAEATVTDGNITSGHVATTFGTAKTYYEIDLGDTYDASGIDQIVSVYKEDSTGDTPYKGYEIQYSENGVDYTTVKVVDGTTAQAAWQANDLIDIQEVKATGAVRYVRLYYPDSYTYGIQVREIAVLSTEQNIMTVEVEHCSDPESLEVSSDNYCEITYTITSGEGQEDYKYMVYLDGTKVGDMVDAGTYTIEDVDAGTYTVTVLSYYNGLTSEGITAEVTVDDGSLAGYVNTGRNLSLGCSVEVYDVETDHKEGSSDTGTLTDGVISTSTANVVETTWGEGNATIILDLGEQVSKNSIDEILIAFKAENTSATNYTVEFSSDGDNYETVIVAEHTTYKETFEDKFDPDAYTKDTVRYVKITLTDGNYNWGYQISEIAVMGGEEYMPEEAAGLAVACTADNTISVTWTGSDNGQTYRVYIDGALKGMNLAAGTYSYTGLSAGSHTVKVTSVINGIESDGVSVNVEVTVEETTENQTTSGSSETTTAGSNETTAASTETTTSVETTAESQTTASQETTAKGTETTTSVETTAESQTTASQETTAASTETTTSVETTAESQTTAGQETTTASTETTAKGSETTAGKEAAAASAAGGAGAEEETAKVKIQSKETAVSNNVGVRKTKVKKAKRISLKKVKIKLKKVKDATGYQVKVSSSKKFKKKKTVKKKYNKRKFTVKSKKFKNKKKLYVKARAYKVVDGKTYYSKWSKRKKVKVKK